MTPRIRTVRDEKGVALPLALFALVMLSGLLLAFLSMAGTEPGIAQNHGSASRAFYIADAGIEHTWGALQTPGSPALPAVGTPLNLFNAQAFGGGSYSVTVIKNPVDGTYALTSTGTYKGSTQTVVMVVNGLPPSPGGLPDGMPPLSAAITSVSNGVNEADFENSAKVYGIEESPAGTCTGQTNKEGWVHGGPRTPNFWFDNQPGYLEGVRGKDDLGHRAFNAATDHPMFNDPVALRAWVSSLASLPGAVNVSGIVPGSGGFSNTMGTAANPQITVWNPGNGEAQKPPALITGYGILILTNTTVSNGHYQWMNFTKGLDFRGLIIVDSPGEVEFQKGTVHGAVIGVSTRAYQKTDDKNNEATKLEWNHTAVLKYNCAALRDYTLPLAKPLADNGGTSNSLTFLSWRQQ
jgi:hypothetical protein